MVDNLAYPDDHIVTFDVMQHQGLRVAGFTLDQIERSNENRNRSRFNIAFGASPSVMCTILEDLQNPGGIDGNEPAEGMIMKRSASNFKWFLRTMLYLRNYPTEDMMERQFNVSVKHCREKVWEMIRRLQLLKSIKITWPDDLGGDDIWIMTVDGTHCWIAEPGHPDFSQDREYFSHKFNKAGINYELGISISSNKLIWMNGPFKAGRNDVTIFVQEGLEQRLLNLGKKCIGDGGYRGHSATVSTPNAHDEYSVKRFKARALKRHEDFNGMTKVFRILRDRFRHPVNKFPLAFEAVCVICQYKIESDEPLYDVLVEDLLQETVEDPYEDIGAAWV